MGIVIRTVFNNQGWKGPCRNPDKDSRCYLCFPHEGERLHLDIYFPPDGKLDDHGFCRGECWERYLCYNPSPTGSRWGCYPPGRKFGKQAQPGTKVYFAYIQRNGRYTLWGTTTIREVNVQYRGEERGYYYLVFEPFEPLPEEKWVKDLSAEELTGKGFRRGTYRFIDGERESYLDRLIERKEKAEEQLAVSSRETTLSLKIRRDIREKLTTMAEREGRTVEEIVREAIAEWLRGRGL